MATDALSLSVETADIGQLAGGRRAIFYDEMAQYGPRYIEGHMEELISIDAEVRYHLNNLLLLSMYFDIIFIQTAAIFNVNDLFLRAVIQRTISHPNFRAMLKADSVRICGWGGKSPREMFSNASDFASMGVRNRFSESYADDLKSLFQPSNVTYRMQNNPQDETARFRRRLRETEIIDFGADLDRVEFAIDQSERRLGSLVSIGFFPALDDQSMSSHSRRAVYASFLAGWSDFLSNAVPGVHTYVAGTDPIAIQQVIEIKGKRLRSFLFSPRIFASFLQKYFSLAELNRILSRPYEDIHKLRNGDWKRFCDAYHSAVETISNSTSDMDFSLLEMFGLEDQLAWGARLWDSANKKESNFDISAFIQSLASLSGAFFAVPFLGPATHAAGVIAGRRLNTFYERILRDFGNSTSPYIHKLRVNLAIQINIP